MRCHDPEDSIQPFKPYNTELFLYKFKILKICNHHKWLSYLLLLHLNTYVMDLPPFEIFYFFKCGDRPYTSESDVYRRQIQTYKDDPRAARFKHPIPQLCTAVHG